MSVSIQEVSPLTGRVRVYFAPVSRATEQPTIFDPAQSGSFLPDAPPFPWVDLGWVTDFERSSGTKIAAVKSGAPAVTQLQVRTDIEATVLFSFDSWGKLQLALSSGTQQLNLLKTMGSTAAEGSGGLALPAVALTPGSTATMVNVTPSDAAKFSVGEWVAIDIDYTGQLGFVGSGSSGAYVKAALSDVDIIRRITLNVGRIQAINDGAITLQSPLLAGAPTDSMKISGLAGFCDREGSSFFQEWSALFMAEGQQGERVLWHYPRLQTKSGIAEKVSPSSGNYEKVKLRAEFRALPVNDPVDNETVICFRSYITA